MVSMSNTFNLGVNMFRRVLGLLFVLTVALFATCCAKGPAVDEHTDKNANAGKPNQQDQSAAATPTLQQTLKGDIERASLDISMARDAANLNKAQEAVSLLQRAKKEIDSALDRKPRLRDELEALKSAIDRAIPAVQNRGNEAEARLAELQTRIGAIKVNTFSQ
jgi:thioredoxin-like negative regulator of GroEL